MTPGRRGAGRAARSATSRHRATWGIERGEWKDLGEVSRGQQDISSLRSASQAILLRGRAGITPAPTVIPAIPCTLFSLLPRETSPRSLLIALLLPQVAHVRGGLLRCATTPVRRPGVIHGVTPPGSVLTLSPKADRYPSDTHWWYRRF